MECPRKYLYQRFGLGWLLRTVYANAIRDRAAAYLLCYVLCFADRRTCGVWGAPGFFINLSNDVADQNGNQIYTAGIGPEESLDGGPLISGYSNPTTTTSTGTFHDTPFGACFPGASGQYCADGHTDTHAATVGSTAYSISTVYNSRQCTEGESVTITGNLPAQNGTITEGTVN
jgi:hypothetical protein